ncbi:COP1-interacting protein 7-like isoform X2 [Vicia villosa]|uniref:COP1-interacting protein 7-like isoform X2 n=1 Tax=Vicia villosa TaxID=3911 RepID=UPI00273C3205|nr:COP1-interacting protein 7-like isoform X2 [Vicia villosa]
MDPSSCLDHALFQLTPTRTRCDLVIVAGGVSEILASGLLEPFLSHLKCAKDQISKGGYSITLHPVGTFAPWFTKATLQRFVRFVSTPEVLERFVTIEKEIVQIEGSVQSSEVEEGRVKRSTNSSNQDGHEENSRVRLQRVLDNRKAMLCKEQAMAYARALVAGYYPESMDDLICFADAFGASRLREACLNFLELCKQKNEDKLWMDEIAAMQVSSQPVLPYLRTSGIVLAGEDESTPSHASLDIGQDDTLPASGQTPSTDGRAQMPKSWPNHHPQYIHNFQGHPFQQMPPYQGGYVYPGMQVPPSSYFPGNMQWPPNEDRSHNDKTSYKKKKKKKSKQSHAVERSEEDESTTSSESSYESDSDVDSKQSKKNLSTEHTHKKKHGKKSSRKVVIRNINYITSKGDGEKGSTTDGSLSNEEEFINGDSLKHKVEEAVASFEKRNKSNSRHHKKQHNAKHLGSVNDSTVSDSNGIKDGNNWDAFQNLLLIDDDDSKRDTEKQPMNFEEEYMMNTKFEDGRSKEFIGEAGFAKTRVVSDDSFVVTQRELNNEGRNRAEYFKEGKAEPTFMQKKNNTDEDLMFSRRNEESSRYYSSSSAVDGLPVEKNKKDILADDSFMIEARSSQNKFNSQSSANISSVSDIIGTTEFTNGPQEGSHKKTETLISREPDDLLMVLDRDSAVEQNATPWRMEMDYENNIALAEANKKPSDVGTDGIRVSNHEGADKKTSGAKNGKISSKDAKSKAPNASLGRSKSEIVSRSRTLPGSKTTVTKSKSEKEEETRKRREELMIQRQKRIAERSASKKSGTETKNSTKKGNPKIHPSNEETKKSNKPVIRSSTINRLATARVTQQKVSPSQPKPTPAKKPSLKTNKVPLQQKKQLPKEVKSSNPKEDARKTKGKVLSDTNAKIKNEVKASPVLPIKPVAAQAVEQNNNNHDLKVIGEVSKASPEKHPRSLISEREIAHENTLHLRTNSSLPNHVHPSGGNQSRGEEVSDKLPSLHGDNMITASTAALPIKPLIYTASNSKVDQKIDESYVTPPKVSEIQSSTPPPSNQAMQESNHNRKKWINDEEDSSKAAKGFRKLLFFGRRS